MEKITSSICLTGDIGTSGNMYGGRLLYLMDEAAAIYAMRSTGEKRMVSRKFSEVEFTSPVHVGEILEFYADNPHRGRTSFSFDPAPSTNHPAPSTNHPAPSTRHQAQTNHGD